MSIDRSRRSSRRTPLVRAVVSGLVLGTSAASANDPPIPPGPPATHPDPGLIRIVEPRGGLLHAAPETISLYFRRYDASLLPQSLELWIDDVEYTEALRFWIDRAWLDLPETFVWTPGDHTLRATIRDATGAETTVFQYFDLLPPPLTYAWPIAEDDPSAIANLMEDYQGFNGKNYWHHGLDIRADPGTTVRATVGGYIGFVGFYADELSAQFNVTIIGDDDLAWQFNHVTESSVLALGLAVGDRVEAGDPIGEVFNWTSGDSQYDHLHMNAVERAGFDVAAWRAQAADQQDTPPAVPEPYDENYEWKWHNPLTFLAWYFEEDTVDPEFGGEIYPGVPDILFVQNESEVAVASDVDTDIELSGDIDIILHVMDTRDDVAGIAGDPYTLGLYELGYTIEPLGPCEAGWVPYTVLAHFDVVPGGFDLGLQNLYLLDILQDHVEYASDDFYTEFDWSSRDFFYNVTNTFFGVPNDALGYWDSDLETINGPLFPDGDYRVTVVATDWDGNTLTRSVDVELHNDIINIPFCIDTITTLELEGMEIEGAGGLNASAGSSSIPISFGGVVLGSAGATIDSGDWPAWSFELPTLGLVIALGVLDGNHVEVEYVPYLGDVILEIPAEAQVLGWDGSGDPPTFDPSAPSTRPVDLRLSTRLARDPASGEALLGTPQALAGVEFDLVLAEPISIAGAGEWVVRASSSGGSSWTLGPACPADLNVDGTVGVPDLLNLLLSWGPCVGCPADINQDGEVNTIDLLELLMNWGDCP